MSPWQKGRRVTPEDCDRGATALHNLSISRAVDYYGDMLRQAGRQLRGRPDASPAQAPPDVGGDVPGGGAND